MSLICVPMAKFLHFPKGMLIQQSPPEIPLPPGKTAQMNCKLSTRTVYVLWYKELQNGSLHGIHKSYEYATPSNEKFSSKVDSTTNTHTLIIRNVQKEDSGVYYCGLAAYLHPNFGTGTRLIVTDASDLRLSILAPFPLEDAELPPDIPLLCLLSDFSPPWTAVLWDTGEEESEGQMGAGAIDGKGLISVWNLMTISSETWNQKTTYTCTAKESSTGRRISATVSKETVVRNGFLVKQPKFSTACEHSQVTEGSCGRSKKGITRSIRK
uniref:Ig-like domain-containing protein n=1 Tax=Pelusios castaneus TaxID=367368 RepID=A0A8C8SJY3_9SAUR